MQRDEFDRCIRLLRRVSEKASSGDSGLDPALLVRALGANTDGIQSEALVAVLMALVANAPVASDATASLNRVRKAGVIYDRLRRSPPRGQTTIDAWIATGKRTKRRRATSK